ncbi:hypothetical protein P175DRAFT_0481329 [Aspergillus ochraceoroseus IBT 24754]|uniref:Leucine-rich repeat-containing protein 40 n=2 Tax=Aspergillus ochraceoroseus TaxID=138278 RepID=A0A2T5LVB0_9EURO|nr:uncharacterized protein P175DRAFT_0481329 [Aspergillus ochraceoroseus IBT 24754]KKK25155.1 hypothetical protein AOCH_002793 [Aspergillus ochraceoroseus]PTU20221.1 hypothetical protein P175DRAFT_0481329 [Aspergillus ochraceoroseus IBT 24754]
MDNQPKTPSRPSGIPRLVSRLPLPISKSSPSLRPSPSREKLRADPGLNVSRLRRPSEEPEFKKPLPRLSHPKKIPNTFQQKRVVSVAGSSDGGRFESDRGLEESPNFEAESLEQDAEARGRTRPSLSDRTIETLAQIPSSPSSSLRQSSFFSATSPMRSFSRPPSSMTNYSRSPSRSSSSRQLSGSDLISAPPSVVRLPSRSRASVSMNDPPSDQSSVTTVESPPKPKRPAVRRSIYGSTDSTATTPAPRLSLGRTPAKPAETETDSSQQPPLQVKKTRKIQPKASNSRLSSAGFRSSSAKSPSSETSADQQSGMEERKVSKSSSALRESIAKAKAARKAVAQKDSQPSSFDAWDETIVRDPFNQGPKDPNHGLLRKRLDAGRTSGHLNIAAMSLTTFPGEVLTMYDFDPNSTTDWYESVDLVKFIAADNEFTELPEAAFPDMDPNEISTDDDEKGNQFGGLEVLDLHGNLLQSLPLGFRRLQRLHTLNLSNNKLSMSDIEVIMEMGSLRDLKLAKNQLEGALINEIGRLSNLEVLDLRENSLVDLPESLADLRSLRVLNVGYNQLTSLPFEALSKLPMKEISAPRNKLSGALIPASVNKFDALQNLDVVGNALVKLSENESLELPSLQTLAISMNRIQSLPNVSVWPALLALSAEDNSISSLPQGFTDLKAIRNVDFTGNDISKLDEKIGLMDSLVTFRIANNPLRERKFLSMTTEDLKRDLRNRCEPEPQETDDEEGSVATQFTLAPETPAQTAGWQVKPGGALDRSYTELQDLEIEQLEHINPNEVRCLYLQHNDLQCFPVPALSLLASHLTDLDMSHNPLDSSSLFTSSITFPSLQNLNLGTTGLVTLEPIFTNLIAPSLTFLDVTGNGLSGALPPVRQTYPKMTTFLAAENQFDSLEFEAVQGLQVLDVGNNNIGALPPKLGLLRAEGCSANWGAGSALRRFEVAGNSFRVPRWQVVAKGTDAILEWLKDRIPAEDLHEWESDDEAN